MARAPNKKAEEAKELYQQGMPLVEIAKKLNIPAGTVRRWKSTYKWSNESERSDSKTNARIENNGSSKKPVVKEVESVLENTKLTEKQRLFCLYFIRSFNAAKAYQKAYQCSYETAMVRGSETLRNVKVKEQIEKLKQEKFNREFLSEADIFQKYMDIAFADMNDYIEIKGNNLSFKDLDSFDGTLIKKVSTGKVSSIELKDSMKALDWIAAHMNMATEEQKAKLELLKAQKEKLSKDDSENNYNDKAEQAKDNIMSILSQIKPIKDGDVLE